MAFIGDFISGHPIASVTTLAIGGSLGYGLSHHFLDFDEPYAIGAGLATGVGSVVGEAYLVSFIPSFKELFDGTVAATSELTAPVATATTSIVQGTGNGISKVGKALDSEALVEAGGFLGGETATFNKDGSQASGNHQLDTDEEKAAFWRMMTNPTEENRRLFDATVASAHRQVDGLQADDMADARFTTNNENPIAVVDDEASENDAGESAERKRLKALLENAKNPLEKQIIEKMLKQAK